MESSPRENCNEPVFGGLAIITSTDNPDIGIVMRIVSVDTENNVGFDDVLPDWVTKDCKISFITE